MLGLRIVASALVIVLMTACGGTSSNGGASPSVTSATPAASETSDSPSSGMTQPESEVPTGTDEPTDEAGGDETEPPKLGPADSGRSLQTKDFRSIEPSDANARDDSFTVGGKDYQGIGVSVSDCGVEHGVTLELRTGSNFHEMKFDFGQDLNLSDSSDQVLVARVEGDGDLRQTKRTPFKELTSIDADITGVAAVRITLYLDTTNCDYQDAVVAVLTNVQVL